MASSILIKPTITDHENLTPAEKQLYQRALDPKNLPISDVNDCRDKMDGFTSPISTQDDIRTSELLGIYKTFRKSVASLKENPSSEYVDNNDIVQVGDGIMLLTNDGELLGSILTDSILSSDGGFTTSDSPISKAVIGKPLGAVVTIEAPESAYEAMIIRIAKGALAETLDDLGNRIEIKIR